MTRFELEEAVAVQAQRTSAAASALRDAQAHYEQQLGALAQLEAEFAKLETGGE